MDENLKNNFKDIAQTLNRYVEFKDLNYLKDIESKLQVIFSSQYVNFWEYDRDTEQLKLMDSTKEKVISLDSSLTKHVMVKKSITIVNHLTSDKYYVPMIDNPLALKVRSLIIFPIYKGKDVLGILKIWRGLNERKVFTKHDEAMLETLSVLFLKVMLSERIDKDELISCIGENKKNASNTPITEKKNKTTGTSPSKKIDHKKEKELNLQSEITQYKNDLKILEKKYKEKELNLQSEITQYKNDLKILEQKDREIESSFQELNATLKESQNTIKSLELECKTLIKENRVLKEESKKTNSIEKLKSQKSLQNNAMNIENNIECLLPHIDTIFSENEYSYMLIELIIYALDSKKGLTEIEEIVKKSKLLPELIESYNFTTDVQVNNEKHILSKLLYDIEQYEKHIFLGEPKINKSVDKSVPVSLVFDKPKVQSIIFHLLIDLYQFINSSKGIMINFKLDNKLFIIELGGFIHTQNSLFKSMFKKTKLRDDDKDRLGLQVSRKLIEKLKGTIEIIYKDEYYQFVIMFPVQFVKM